MSPKSKSWLLIAIPASGLPLSLSNAPRTRLVGELIVYLGGIGVCLYLTLAPKLRVPGVTAELRWWTFACMALLFCGWFLRSWRPGNVRIVGDLIVLLGYIVMARVLLLRYLGDYRRWP